MMTTTTEDSSASESDDATEKKSVDQGSSAREEYQQWLADYAEFQQDLEKLAQVAATDASEHRNYLDEAAILVAAIDRSLAENRALLNRVAI
ncbi:hypothetical protein BV25DRAFT_1825440 [Artomyces pyxidatus]|uniref:Uncharacterized protein n=1 Tax=Artomyces pyxidatus TaxID=48021 RepID=A0ACB8T1U4_9AGAM|nr:hypothetical protein BV25DRAFT_1825440 [Artomyces pyxidatus]